MLSEPLEIQVWQNHTFVLGMDEAGRGPIAGPLVVAGVIFNRGYVNPKLDDSKKLSEKKREALFYEILKDAVDYKIVFIDEKKIDEENIYRATQNAMSFIAREMRCDYILSDAMPLVQVDTPFEAVVKGDQKSISIAAASILAKVSRDRWMKHLDMYYPEYGLAKHKGYPTKAHIEALETYGLQDFYRHSYGPVQKMDEIRLF